MRSSAGDWELRVRAGPMLRSAETRSLCASRFAPRRPVRRRARPAGRLSVRRARPVRRGRARARGRARTVVRRGRARATGARVAIDASTRCAAGRPCRRRATPPARSPGASGRRSGRGGRRPPRARRGAGGAGEADDVPRPAPAWDWTFETDYGGTLGRAGDGAPDGSRVAEAVERALRERLWAPENRPPRGAPAAAPAWVEDAAATAAASREAVEAAWRADPVEYRTRVPLFEDALHDGGLSALDCSVATTRRTWFLVLRQTIVVLGRFARVRDVTFFFDGRACYRTKTERVAAAPRAIDLRRLAPSLREASWPFAGAVAERLGVDGRAVAAPRAAARRASAARGAARAAPGDGDAAPRARGGGRRGDAVVVALAVDGALKVARFPRAAAPSRRRATPERARGGDGVAPAPVVAATVDGGAVRRARRRRAPRADADAPRARRAYVWAPARSSPRRPRVALAAAELHLLAPPDGAAATARRRASWRRRARRGPGHGALLPSRRRRGDVRRAASGGVDRGDGRDDAVRAARRRARRDGGGSRVLDLRSRPRREVRPRGRAVRRARDRRRLEGSRAGRRRPRPRRPLPRGRRRRGRGRRLGARRRAAVVDPVARRRCLRCAAPAAVVAVALGAAFVAAVDVRGGVSCRPRAARRRRRSRGGPHDATPAFRLDRDDVFDAVCPEDDATALVAATRASVALLVRDARLAPPSA